MPRCIFCNVAKKRRKKIWPYFENNSRFTCKLAIKHKSQLLLRRTRTDRTSQIKSSNLFKQDLSNNHIICHDCQDWLASREADDGSNLKGFRANWTSTLQFSKHHKIKCSFFLFVHVVQCSMYTTKNLHISCMTDVLACHVSNSSKIWVSNWCGNWSNEKHQTECRMIQTILSLFQPLHSCYHPTWPLDDQSQFLAYTYEVEVLAAATFPLSALYSTGEKKSVRLDENILEIILQCPKSLNGLYFTFTSFY